MPKNIRTEDFKLESVRLSYPYLFAPRKREEKGAIKLTYEAVLLYPKANLPLFGITSAGAKLNIADECLRIAKEHWGDKAIELVQNEIIKNPFKDGDGKDGLNQKTGERTVGYAGHKFIRVASGGDRPPALYGAHLGADGKLVKLTDPASLYPGCYVNAVVNAFTWENDLGGRGISFGLSMMQFAKDGERISTGGPPAADKFLSGQPATVAAGAVPDAAKTAGAGGLFA